MDSISNLYINTLLLSLTIVLCFFSIPAGAEIVYLYTYCPNTTTIYQPNSIHHRNLNSLLSSLSSYSTKNMGFYDTTAGEDFSNTVYGLYLCRGDVTMDVCQECVATASKEIIKRCPRKKESIIWYDECMLRYSNQIFFSQVQDRPWLRMWNTQNVSETERFMSLLKKTLNDTTRKAANDQSGKKFATGEVNFTSYQSLYTLVQCSPDLSAAACNSCLQEANGRLPMCCDGKVGGRTIFPSCNVRYELYRFYEVPVTAPAPSPIPLFLPPPGPGRKGKRKVSTVAIIAIVVPIFIAIILFVVGYCFMVRKTKKLGATKEEDETDVGADISSVESLQFDFGVIEAATNKFSAENRLGEGGFGVVYKGMLPDGQQIAVKRLSSDSDQGAEQFKNEVVLVAKLQHRNLVRLLGFCLQGEEKILIYEFVPNKSLDYFLFDPEKQGQLDWSRRYKIIGGIARGIHYIHEDSRLKIVHRDLKASNILLDAEMNPQISDFGMARIFGLDQTQENTSRIVGTYGYLAPEYAMHGQFSMKSDIYSFGVLVLEIISGKKNSFFDQSENSEDLLSYAWKHWSKGTALQFLDESIGDSSARNEVIRCLQIGLLCVQENPAERPTMAAVALMLDNFSVTLPLPQKPAFFLHRSTNQWRELGSSTSKSIPGSVDDASITQVHPR